jgi:hypothetical protein
LGVQETHSACQTFGLMHTDSDERRHDPVDRTQQAPCAGGQGLGEQTAQSVYQWLGSEQSLSEVIVHPPVDGSQQAPLGRRHGLGEQVVQLAFQVLGPAQLAWIVRLQAPSVVQQAPNGGQGLGSQLAAPFHSKGPVQAVCRTSVQAPSDELQQAPGCEQGLGEQLVHSECQTLGEVQLPWGVKLQAPSVVQQAPNDGQGLGSQFVRLPR